jgi:hypothetical protein
MTDNSSKRPIQKPEVSALLHAALDEIKSAGVEPSAEDVIWLHDLCVRQIIPDSTRVDPYIDPPAHIAGMELWPLTIQAEMWLENYAFQWWNDDNMATVLATAWAMYHSNPNTETNHFLNHTGRIHSWLAIRAWAFKQLTCSKETLKWACEKILGRKRYEEVESGELVAPSATDPGPSSLQWGGLIASVCNAIPALKPVDVLRMTSKQCLDLLKHGQAAKSEMGYSTEELEKKETANAFFEYRLAIRHIILQGANRGE